MKPQSLSILVPAACPNNCACCVSKLHDSPYKDQLGNNFQFENLYREDYKDAMRYARDNDCNDLIFTGENGECLMNKNFMRTVVDINKSLPSPFVKNELQTSGCFLLEKSSENNGQENLRWLRDFVRIKIISLSLFDIFDSNNNSNYSRPKNKKSFVDIEETCKAIKKYNFTLRLSINMTNLYEENRITPEELFKQIEKLGANQVTFRILYFVANPKNAKEQKINDWILANKASDEYINTIKDYIRKNGHPLEKLSFGAIRYSVNNLSTVIDDNCMSVNSVENIKEEVKYLILRPDCKLYTKWDDSGSLVF
jgi:hypothetical protein